jgi:transposase-like protein
MSKKGVEYAKDLKLSAVRRMLAGTNVSALARELGVKRKRLYAWCAAFRARGPDGMRGPGRPRKAPSDPPRVGAGPAMQASAGVADGAAAQRRIAELERKVGQQALELDFFRRALQQVEASRRPSDGPGATASTPSSRRRRSGKAS